jgi:hypothetical protein
MIRSDRSIRDLEAMYSKASPRTSTHAFLKHWFMSASLGNSPIRGVDRLLYRKNTPRPSLMSIFPSNNPDPLSDFFLNFFRSIFHNTIGRYFKRNRVRYNDDTEANGPGTYFHYGDQSFLRIADVVGSVISSTWLVTSITILYFLKDMKSRLGIIAVFTVGFSLILSLLTHARRSEVFGGSAA